MTEAINAHKKMAMGMTEGNVMKKGGKVRKYANGGLSIFGPSISKKDKEIMESPMKKVNSSVQKTKSGGGVKRYANGGAVAESKVANLPAMGDKRNTGVDFNAGKAKVATMKKGGMAKTGIMIAIGIPKRAAGRGR